MSLKGYSPLHIAAQLDYGEIATSFLNFFVNNGALFDALQSEAAVSDGSRGAWKSSITTAICLCLLSPTSPTIPFCCLQPVLFAVCLVSNMHAADSLTLALSSATLDLAWFWQWAVCVAWLRVSSQTV